MLGLIARRAAALLPGLVVAGLSALLAGSRARADEPDRFDLVDLLREHAELSAIAEVEWAHGTSNGREQKLELVVEPELRVALPFDLDLTAIGRVRGDAYDRIEPGKPGQREISVLSRRELLGDNVDLELRELYVEATLRRTYLTLGKQQIVWGQADGLKVLDVVNPQTFREFILRDFDYSRIPLWAVNAETPIKDAVLQLIWIPDPTFHEIPERGAVFEFTAPALLPAVPPGAQVVSSEVNRPSNLLSDSDAGAQLSTFWGGWDLTLNYFYHYSDTPVFETVPTGPNQVKVRQRYERSHLVGGSFSNAFGDLTLRGEVVFASDRYFTTRNASDSNGVVRTNEIAYVLGFDWYGFRESLVSLQLFQSALTSHRSGVIRDRVDSVVTLLLRRELWNDRLLLESIWLHDVNQDDGLLRPKVEYEIRDGVKAWAGFDWFYGSRNGVFGQFDGEDRLVLGFEVGL